MSERIGDGFADAATVNIFGMAEPLECWIMGTRMVFEMVLSDNALRAAREYDVNIPKVAVSAVVDELLMKQQIADHVGEAMSPDIQNKKLRQSLQETMAELKQARQELREFMMRDKAELESICLFAR